jgi:flagellar hook-basal body complex protein FliE
MREIHGLPAPIPAPSESALRPAPGAAFGEVLGSVVRSAVARDSEALAHVDRFVSGGPGELHETAIAASKAEIAFRLMMSVRNRLLETYREVMRMGM